LNACLPSHEQQIRVTEFCLYSSIYMLDADCYLARESGVAL